MLAVLHSLALPHNLAILHNLAVALHSLRLSSPTRLPAETVPCLRFRPKVASQFLHEITNVNIMPINWLCACLGAGLLDSQSLDSQSQTQLMSQALDHRY
jgi:hypothetical protein